jgi:hypothetical protein
MCIEKGFKPHFNIRESRFAKTDARTKSGRGKRAATMQTNAGGSSPPAQGMALQ